MKVLEFMMQQWNIKRSFLQPKETDQVHNAKPVASKESPIIISKDQMAILRGAVDGIEDVTAKEGLKARIVQALGSISPADRQAMLDLVSIIPTEEVQQRWKSAIDASTTWEDLVPTITTIGRFKNKTVKSSFQEFFCHVGTMQPDVFQCIASEVPSLDIALPRPIVPAKDDADARCQFCGGTNFRQSDKGAHDSVCLDCGSVKEDMTFDFSERRAFDADQARNRRTHDITSNLLFDKNLGSTISMSRKYYGNYTVFRLINAERKLAVTLQQRELKEVIRILSLLTDSNKLSIVSSDVEDLIVSYRKKFLGNGLAVGRLRNMVIAAFVFLELRTKDRYKFLTYDQYKKMISLPEDMEKVFKKSVTYLVKEHGYRLRQAALEDSVQSVMLALDIEPKYIVMAKELASKVKSYYARNSRKNSGIIAAIIYIVLKKTEKYKGITQEEATRMVNGVKSIITVRKRISEIRAISSNKVPKQAT